MENIDTETQKTSKTPLPAAFTDGETKALLHWFSAAKSQPVSSLTPQTARENYKKSLAKTDIPAPEVASIENITIRGQGGELPLRIYRPQDQQKGLKYPAILFCHGGGCVFGDLDTHEPLCAALCADTQAIVISVGYRLAPEHTFPAPIEDGISAFRWLIENTEELGIDPARIAVTGDSAGAGIMTATVQECLGKVKTMPCAQLLIYPAIDVTGSSLSRKSLSDMFPVPADTLEWFFNHYFGETWPLHDKRAHPMKYDNYAQIPTLIMTAGLDPLKDEALSYGKKMEQSGVPVEYLDYEGTIHGFMGMGRLLRKAHRAARQDIAAFLRLQFKV